MRFTCQRSPVSSLSQRTDAIRGPAAPFEHQVQCGGLASVCFGCCSEMFSEFKHLKFGKEDASHQPVMESVLAWNALKTSSAGGV